MCVWRYVNSHPTFFHYSYQLMCVKRHFCAYTSFIHLALVLNKDHIYVNTVKKHSDIDQLMNTQFLFFYTDPSNHASYIVTNNRGSLTRYYVLCDVF